MKRATVVIGANWGDEGKGLMTDYHSDENTVVVRFNGGPQAGHTVYRGEHRHEFHHFGAGTLNGACTFLSKYFLNNPVLYFQELKSLHEKGFEPEVFVHPDGLVTTPWDMMINQMVEESRGHARHGSCGMGINETIKRSELFINLHINTLTRSYFSDVLNEIEMNWVPRRLNEFGIEPNEEWQYRLHKMPNGETVQRAFREYCEQYLKSVKLAAVPTRSKIVFEGAQGLLLDEDHYFFPHVTHSHTGLKNVMEMTSEIGLTELDVVYATRAYATRHGAGPFPHEEPEIVFEDHTNVHNEWQGTIRFGELDLDLLAESILNVAKHGVIPFTRKLAITCFDQLPVNAVPFWKGGQRIVGSQIELVREAYASVKADTGFMSFGPSARHVRNF